ncbi:hypothetical protein [Tautonia plasticadhaerens]|uniref:Lipoprotein n=1 Tax=Tautonia plasticadhaerens TaxID=2527974 RepID=A0A518H6Y0_9BACT|nr:hypothetical protein [Tautonia plasticadhaerens]QDV36605.1 hypothetical protein ElP_45330 [Tautonia plasticadhaerens]
MRALIGLFLAASLAGATAGCGSGANPGVIDPGIAPPPPKQLDANAAGARPPTGGGSQGNAMDYSK